MRKFASLLLALVLILTFAVPCLAADNSPEKEVVIIETEDDDGNEVPIEIIDIPEDIALADIGEIMGGDYAVCMTITEAFTITTSADPKFPVKIVFSVAGVTPTTTGSVVAYNGAEWIRIPTEFGTDQITAVFPSFGPTAFIINIEGCEATWYLDTEYAPSPKTYDNSGSFALLALLSVFSLAAVFAFRKYQEEK